jgi:hypothetical protein
MKNAVFWDITPCCSCSNRRLEERIASISRVERNSWLGTMLEVPSSLILYTFMKEAIRPSETSVLTIATRRHIQEDGVLQD